MASVVPSFITGANAKIKVGSLTLAFASDVSYEIRVSFSPVRAMGMLEVAAYEPMSYTVSGSFSVVRYTKDAASADIIVTSLIDDDDDSRTPAKVKTSISGKVVPGTNSSGNSIHQWKDKQAGDIGRHLDPGSILKSLTFDLEIFSKYSKNETESILKIRDCKIVSKSGSLTKKGLMIDNFEFNAIFADNDESISVSGTGYRDLKKD